MPYVVWGSFRCKIFFSFLTNYFFVNYNVAMVQKKFFSNNCNFIFQNK